MDFVCEKQNHFISQLDSWTFGEEEMEKDKFSIFSAYQSILTNVLFLFEKTFFPFP